MKIKLSVEVWIVLLKYGTLIHKFKKTLSLVRIIKFNLILILN